MGLYQGLGEVLTLLTDKVEKLTSKVQENERKISDLRQINERNQRNQSALSYVPGSGNVLQDKPTLGIITAIASDLATVNPIIDDPSSDQAANLNQDSDNSIAGVWIKDGKVNDLVLVFFVGIYDPGTTLYYRQFIGINVGGGTGVFRAKIVTITSATFDVNPYKADGTVDIGTTLTVTPFFFHATAVNTAFPLLTIGDDVAVFKSNNNHYCVFPFQGFTECT